MQRCKAKSKRSGEQCKNYAMREFTVCRMHGARGGPKTDHGQRLCKIAPMRHGFYSQEQKKDRASLRYVLNAESL